MQNMLSFPRILLGFFGFIALLLVVRVYFTGELYYLFLVWNLFLAWVPYVISSYFERLHHGSAWMRAGLFCCWLAFFPNALYIVTDLIHLDKESNVPKWYDAVLLLSASTTGLMMAFISLMRVEYYFREKIHKKLQPLFIPLILFLGSFGVYLGRFLRWNSWDIVSSPFQLIISVIDRVIFPLDHLQTWSVTFIFTIFFYLLYMAVKKMPGDVRTAKAVRRISRIGKTKA